MTRNLIIPVISFILTLIILMFIRWYEGYNLLERNKSNANYFAFVVLITSFSTTFLYILLLY